jgi:signal recognition particle GTPase
MIKEFLEIMKAMTEEELLDPSLIKGVQKDRIGVQSGKGADKVADLLTHYKQSLIIHTWFHHRYVPCIHSYICVVYY